MAAATAGPKNRVITTAGDWYIVVATTISTAVMINAVIRQIMDRW